MSDKLRLVFHVACDEGDISNAEQRLNELCKHAHPASVKLGSLDRRQPENLGGPCERLANLMLWRQANCAASVPQPDEDHLSS